MRNVALGLFLAVVSSGCALTEMSLPLPDRQLESTIPGGVDREVIVVVPLQDERTIQNRCGMKKNGYNMDTASAVCESDPNIWFAELLAEELRLSGFTVLSADDPHKTSAVQIDGSLLKLFVEPVIGAWSGSLEADLSVKLRATSETGLDAERTFTVKGWKGGVIVGTTQPYITSLHRATQALLEETVRAVLELMDDYPQLGWLHVDDRRVAVLSEETQL